MAEVLLSFTTFINPFFVSITMDLSSVIECIKALNEQGVKLADSLPLDYGEAIVRHQEAATLARRWAGNLNPDYLAFSIAEEGFARRRKGDDRTAVLNLLEEGLEERRRLMEGWLSKEETRKASYAGEARLLEEMALVRRYTPDVEVVQDLTQALSELSAAVSLYQQAVGNAPAEILPKEVIESRLWRNQGITSAVATELARNEPSRKTEHLQTALFYAQQELESRLAVGESAGFSLLNAYHTLGVAQTELVGENQTMYTAAKANLQQAKSLAEQANRGLEITTLTFREAWLEYRRDQSDLAAITPLIQQVLDFQQTDTHCWDEGTKKALRPQIRELATHLGHPYQQKIEALYSRVPL